MCEGLESVESEYAKEGTEAHLVASSILEHYFFRTPVPPELKNQVRDASEAVKLYVNFVKAEALESGADIKQGHVMIEHKFDLTSVYPGLFGTADSVIYFPKIKKLQVTDYKNGAGIPVEVEGNLQLMYYGLGALLSTGLPCETVELVVVQPRCEHENGPIRRWTFSTIDLIDFAADLAFDAAATAAPDAPLKPGKHCRFCAAAPVKCPAIRNKAIATAKLEFGPTLSYDPAQLDIALKALPAIEAWVTKVREFAYGEAMHGRTPPGWKMVAKRATRKWNATEEAIVNYMADATKKDKKEFYSTPDLKTPAQMEKLCNKQIGEGLRKMMVSVSSGYNMVPESDPRPPVKLDPATEFTQLTGDE